MLVTFSHRHCLGDSPVKKAVPNSIVVNSGNKWVAIRWGLEDWIWFPTIFNNYLDNINYYGTSLDYVDAKQHPPKTVVSMVQE